MRYKGIKGKVWETVRKYVKSKEKDCYTCGAKNLIGQNAQAGHFIPVALAGSNNTLSWDPRQIHLQCGRCNGAGQGQAVAYRLHLVTDYGEKIVKELEARRWKVDPIKDWNAIIENFAL
jgi:5-methylcytosine-specific restriction endonuclease McrA